MPLSFVRQRAAVRRAKKRILIGRTRQRVLGPLAPAIFDPLGARVTRRTFATGGVLRAGRNRRLF